MWKTNYDALNSIQGPNGRKEARVFFVGKEGVCFVSLTQDGVVCEERPQWQCLHQMACGWVRWAFS